MSEAALVGGLADWFAVVALFRKPLGIRYHTAIIPESKDKIADNLADFVKTKFFQPEALSQLIAQRDPAAYMGKWLSDEATMRSLGQQASKLVLSAFKMVGEGPIQAFLRDAMHTAVDKVDVAPALGSILDTLTKGGRHQALLDASLEKLQDELKNPVLQEQIAQRVVSWLRTEHKYLEKVLPSETIGKSVADALLHNVRDYLSEIANKPQHELRMNFDTKLGAMIHKLKHDEGFRQKGEELKAYIKGSDELNAYLQGLWGSLRQWLENDLKAEDSVLQKQVASMGQWLSRGLLETPALREALNAHVRDFVVSVGPGVAEHLTQHISTTIKKWDKEEMSKEIELNIGSDLQYIRISGTLVGGVIGLLLFVVFEAVAHFKG